jgi:hypothetical protein
MESIATVILAVITILLWTHLWTHRNKYISASSNDWMILETHRLLDHDNCLWDQEEPFSLEFVPIVVWETKGGYKYPVVAPITPPAYRVNERLNANLRDKLTKYETRGYWIRDGAIFDIDDMGVHRHSDLWSRLYDCAFAGHDIEVHGYIPDCYRQKFSEIMKILAENRAKKHDLQQDEREIST